MAECYFVPVTWYGGLVHVLMLAVVVVPFDAGHLQPWSASFAACVPVGSVSAMTTESASSSQELYE